VHVETRKAANLAYIEQCRILSALTQCSPFQVVKGFQEFSQGVMEEVPLADAVPESEWQFCATVVLPTSPVSLGP
jgi:hypothetical protein